MAWRNELTCRGRGGTLGAGCGPSINPTRDLGQGGPRGFRNYKDPVFLLWENNRNVSNKNPKVGIQGPHQPFQSGFL